jgi:hypothetical protein
MDNEVTPAGDLWVDAWFSLWYRPRATMRLILDTDPRKFVLPIAFAAGVVAGVYGVVAPPSIEPSNLPHLHLGPIGIAIAIVISGLVSIVTLYGLASLYRWSGHLLGGTANKVEMRSALAWAQVPGLYLQVVNIMTAALGFESPTGSASVSPYGLVEAIIGIWVFVILLKCVGEAHRFSAWRALGAMLLGTLSIAAVAIGSVLIIWLIASRLM